VQYRTLIKVRIENRYKLMTYPEAPVPKSIAITCVKAESSFKKAICFERNYRN
jgi:hypothetical protein